MEAAIQNYVSNLVTNHKDAYKNAEFIIDLVHRGTIPKRNIKYNSNGTIISIRGTEMSNGIIKLKETSPKKDTFIEVRDSNVIPEIEGLKLLKRERIKQRRNSNTTAPM